MQTKLILVICGVIVARTEVACAGPYQLTSEGDGELQTIIIHSFYVQAHFT
jgi:hypothetical protein